MRDESAEISDLEAHLGYWLRFVSNSVSQAFQRKVEAEGVTVSEWVVMRCLYGLRETSPGALADAIGMSKGAISKLLTRLEGKALVHRAVRAHDRRQQMIALTPEGEALVPRLARLADDNDAWFFGHLSPETRAELRALMQEIVRRHHLESVPVD